MSAMLATTLGRRTSGRTIASTASVWCLAVRAGDVSDAWQTASVIDDGIARTIAWDGAVDLLRTFAPLVRGPGDRTIRVGSGRLWWTTRTADGPATLRLDRVDGAIQVHGWGAGATRVVAGADRLLGLDDPGRAVATIADAADPRVARLARRFAAVRLPRTEAVFDALVPAMPAGVG